MAKRLKVEYVKTDALKEYANNAKIHTPEQIEQIKQSIQEFGFNDPVAIWKNGEIIEGHGRVQAARELGLDAIPVIRLDSLTDEQRRAYTLIHNQLTMNTGFDADILEAELDGLSYDMEAYGFEYDAPDFFEPDAGRTHEEYAQDTQKRVENILQLGYAQFPGVGAFDVPEIYGVTEAPDVEEWIGFNYVLSDTAPEDKGVHFFIDDYQFERVWNDPEAYVDKLKRYKAVLAPDFSPYGDMPLACQIFNHYRKHWVAAYWQRRGIRVIPTIRASSDPRSLEWFLDGEPRHSVVAYSTMWDGTATRKEYETMMATLEPSHVILYGEPRPYTRMENTSLIQTFTEERRYAWRNQSEEERDQRE